jgi:hypothetical protein
MRPSRKLALVLAGSVRATPFERFPGLKKLVTHVLASSYREASRVANGMYFARACRTVEEAAEANVFLICDENRVTALARAAVEWRGKTVLLVVPDAEAMAELYRARGAHVALVTVLDELIPCHFFLEGDGAAVAIARALLESVHGEVSVTENGARLHVEAMRILAGPVLMAVLEGADLNLRQTGLALDGIRGVLGRMALETLRVHQRSKARTWRATDRRALEQTLEALALTDPKLEQHLRASEAAARGLIEKQKR